MRVLIGLGLCWLWTLRKVVASEPCVTTTNEISFMESRISDTSVHRTYTICANTVLRIGRINYDNELVGGQDMLPLRRNMRIRCGNTGESSNRCIFTEGDLFVDGTHHYGIPDKDLENVVVEGLTFLGAANHAVWITKRGSVTFRQCIFRESRTSNVPVLADYSNPNSHLTVTFYRSQFIANRYGGQRSHPALVVGNGSRNRFVFQKTRFEDNDMIQNNTMAHTNSFLISTSGPISLHQNCFQYNQVGVSPIASYGSEEVIAADNFQSSSLGPKCSFVSKFIVASDVKNMTPLCLQLGTSPVCQETWTESPTEYRSKEPSSSPSVVPTSTPSSGPSREISQWPTRAPSYSPSAGRSIPPSVSPTSVPSSSPIRPKRTFPPYGEPPREDAGFSLFRNRPSSGNDRYIDFKTVAVLTFIATWMAL